MEEWVPLQNFPGYFISNRGYVRKEDSSRDLKVFINTSGSAYISLWRDKRSHSRSLPRLVAETFLDPPPTPAFDTPINLNGDGRDNRTENLMWRPRWFAVKYHQQFDKPWNGWSSPIMLFDTGEVFPNSWTACMKYGILNDDLVVALANRDPVWPTRHTYLPYKPHTKQYESHGL